MIVSVPADIQAQSLAMRVNIPFQFHVGNTALPAGAYMVQKTGEAVRVSDQDGHAAMILTTAVRNRAAAVGNQLSFHRYGNDYFLSEVRWSEYSTARGLMKSKTEIQIASALTPQRVVTAANQR